MDNLSFVSYIYNFNDIMRTVPLLLKGPPREEGLGEVRLSTQPHLNLPLKKGEEHSF